MDDCCDDGMVNAKACCGDSEQDTTAIAAAMHAFILVAIVLFDGCGVVWMDNKYYVLQLQQDGQVFLRVAQPLDIIFGTKRWAR